MKEEEELENQNQEPETNPIDDSILQAFFEFYEPAGRDDPEADRRTTLQLLEEMDNIDSVPKWFVTNCLLEKGFKITYTESGPYWLLKPKA